MAAEPDCNALAPSSTRDLVHSSSDAFKLQATVVLITYPVYNRAVGQVPTGTSYEYQWARNCGMAGTNDETMSHESKDADVISSTYSPYSKKPTSTT
jgi:hypothetical protein